MPAGLLQLPTTGAVTGLQNNQDANAALAALATAIQGGSAPTTGSTGLASMAGVLWHDTTNNVLKLRNQADTAWITLFNVNEAGGTATPLFFGVQFYTFLRGYLGGLQLSNDGTTPNTTIDISPGVAVTDDQLAILTTSVTFTKTTAAWAAGSGAGALDAGSVAASTWYHVYIIFNATTGALDFLISTSLTPTMPAGFTNKRRLGSIKTNASSNILPFVQRGDVFIWKNASLDVNITNLSTTQLLETLAGVPPGLPFDALIRGNFTNAAAANLLLSPPDESGDTTITTGNLTASCIAGGSNGFNLTIRTNASQQINALASAASTTLHVNTYGWIDTRGRFD